jgi:alpha-glucosidase
MLNPSSQTAELAQRPRPVLSPLPQTGYEWWKRGIVYQIYPLSFQDSDGNGKGDLNGIRQRLDYLVDLGVDAIWISPIYPSPLCDYGYDVSDYCAIDPLFGSMADFDALLAQAHSKGLKVILDFVPNHTSDQHPWFRESRSSRANPKRDWYIWRDAAPGGGPPNNWLSEFGGSGWQLDAPTGQYYYHAFLKEQPDLNWRNPQVRAAMHDVLRFWLNRGVDGFRVDVVWHLIKDAEFRNDLPNPDYQPGDPSHRSLLRVYSADRPEVLQVIAEMRKVLDAYPDRVLIGETHLPLERLMAYYGDRGEGVHLPFNFHLIYASWNATEVRRIVTQYEQLLSSHNWPNWVLGSHDKPRIRSRVGEQQARVAAMLLLTLRGTPTMYYGDEIGMEDGIIAPEQVRDGWEKNEPGLGLSRDPQRTPMQWNASANAGFSSAAPWLPLAPDHPRYNVEDLGRDGTSILQLYRKLIALRRKRRALAVGNKTLVEGPEQVIAYERSIGRDRVLIALNFGHEQEKLALGDRQGKVLLSTHLDREGAAAAGELHLRPDEGVIVDLR